MRVAVRDLAAATDAFATVLGPAVEVTAMSASFHVDGLGLLEVLTPDPASPDPIQALFGERLVTCGDGIVNIAFHTNDIAAAQRALEQTSIRFLFTEPLADGECLRNITVPSTTHGVCIELRDGTRGVVPTARPSGTEDAGRAYVLYVAVHDLEKAAATFRAVTGEQGIAMPDGMASDALHAVHFPLDGLYALGVIALRREPVAADARRFASFLAARGEGAALIGFLVPDLDRAIDRLATVGVEFEFRAPVVHDLGRIMWTKPTHGVTIALSEHKEQAYAMWRSKGRPA